MKPKSNQISWLEKYAGHLGKLGDAELAKLIGISRGYVKKIRLQKGIHIELKIPPYVPAPLPWTRKELRTLGKASDQEAAKRLGHSLVAVRDIRKKLNIQNPFLM